MSKPKIRFKGFTDDWEQHKLGDIGYAKSGVGFPDSEQGGQKGISFFKVSDMNTNGNENELVVANNYVTDEQIARKHWNVIYDVPAIFFAKVGAAVMLNRKRLVRFPFLLDNNTMAYVFEKKVWNCDFGKTLFETIDLTKLTQVGALPSYNSSDIESIQILIPKFEEQTKIGQYFSQLDNLITLHQRKYDKLVNIKKSMLEKMFPQNGASVPEIRFKGFTDDWEQRKVGEKMYIKSRIGWQALTKQEYLDTGDYYLITGTDIDESSHRIDLNRCYYVSKERYEMDNKIQVHEGDIIVTKDGTIGKVAMVTGLDKPATLNSHLFVLRDLSGTLDNHFLLHILNSPIFDRFVKSTKTGSTLTGLPQNTFVKFQFACPKIKEQKRIASYLDNLDNLITLHQRKIEKLKNIKKSCLEKMLV